MKDQSYGAYTSYFSIVKNFGAFPYKLEGDGGSGGLRLQREGPFYWLYLLNFSAATFHAFFQLFQLILMYLEGHTVVDYIGQLTWVLLAALPMSNYIKSIAEEPHFAGIIDEWCRLERKIIGSSFRGLMHKETSTTLSTCHYKQRDRVNFVSRYYIVLGLIGAVGVGCHSYYAPNFPSYLSSLVEESSADVVRGLSVAFQLWIYLIIWSNVYLIEVLTTIMSSSVGHWCCDEIPILDLISASINSSELDQNENESGLLDKVRRKGSSALFSGTEDFTEFFPKTEMSRVIQNLVDIEFGLEGYLRVESLIEAFNHSFGRMIPGHQFVYLIMLTIQGFNAIQFFSTMHSVGVILYTLLMFLFLFRMLVFFPAMGNLDHRSDSFIDSWMEGLRYIPKGKQSYELYWYRIKSCRLLDFRCGRYFNMERQTCLEFLFRVSEFVIVLMQISY